MKAKITVIKNIGCLVIGEIQVLNAEKIEDNGNYWSIFTKKTHKSIVSKENWNLEIFTDDKQYKKMLINKLLEQAKNNPLVTKDLKEVKKELKKEPIKILEHMCNIVSC